MLLESLDRRDDVGYVVGLTHDAESEHENRIARIDTVQSVVSTFIDEDKEVGKAVAHAATPNSRAAS